MKRVCLLDLPPKIGSTFTQGDIVYSIVVCVLWFSRCFSTAQKYLWMSFEDDLYFRISTVAFDKVMILLSDHDGKNNSASLWKSIGSGQSIRYAYRSILFHIIPAVIDLWMGVFMLYFLYGAYMAMILVILVAASLWVSREIHCKLQNKRRQFVTDMNKEQHVLQVATSSWQTALSPNRISYEKAQYSQAVAQHMSSSSEFFLWSCFDSVLQLALVIPGIIGACTLAAFQVTSGVISIGYFITLMVYLTRLGLRLQHLRKGIQDASFNLTKIDELVRFFGRVPNVSNHAAAEPLHFEQGAVGFRDVHFSYRDQKKTLKGISFEVSAGQTVALVGATGSGKSTVLSLLSRVHDPLEGSITIDGQDIRNATLESLHANVGIVPQNPMAFHGSIMNNITCGDFPVPEEQIYDACKAVALHDKFKSLANGYQTMLGEGGVTLSGGELQRLAIARALIHNPKILLLDEAINSVDSSTEILVQRNLRHWRKGRTTFIIAYVMLLR